MSRFIRQFSFALVFVATLAASVAAQPPSLESPSLEPQLGVLALRSGGVIAGRYLKLGDQYVIEVNGGEIRINVDKVEVACRSLEQAYQLKRTALTQHSVSSHLRLAQWCIRHKLFDPAASEINTARDIDDGDRRIALVERRLQAVRWQQATTRKTTSQPVPIPDQGELERWLDGLPRRSIEQFANTIQPLLSNRCATGACHGATSDRVDVHVLRVSRGRSISRRATARNLREVMKWVDRERPDESPLLVVPTRPHATAESAIFSSHSNEQYRRLVVWVYGLSQPSTGTAPSRSNQELTRPFADAPVMRSQWGTTPPLLQPTTVPWRQSPRVGRSRMPVHHALAQRHQALEAAAAGNPETLDVASDDGGPNAKKQRNAGSARGAGAGTDGYVPVDEFDPEIFNRRLPAASEEP